MNVTSLEEGRCKKFRSYLDSYLNNELLVETNHEVLKHLESCNACSQTLADRGRVKAALKQAVSLDVAPASLRSRIEQEIRATAKRPARGFQLTPRWAMAAAAAFVIAFGSWGAVHVLKSKGFGPRVSGVTPFEQSIQLLSVGLDDHVTCAVQHHQEDKRFTPEQMNEKLGPEYAGLVPVVREHMPAGYELIVAHRCHVNQREFIHLILRNQEKVLSLVVTRKNGEAFPADSALAVVTAAGVPMHEARLQDYEIAGFESPAYLGYVISNVEHDENRLIAGNLAPAVRAFLETRG